MHVLAKCLDWNLCSCSSDRCFPNRNVLCVSVSCAQRQRFHGHFQYLFIESICNDQAVLEQNYRYKMMYSPDYAEFNDEQVCFLASEPVHSRTGNLFSEKIYH